MQNLEHLSTQSLRKKRNLSNFALQFVWFGAAVAIAAACYSFLLYSEFPKETFFTAILALIASIPVFLERKRILEILDSRKIGD